MKVLFILASCMLGMMVPNRALAHPLLSVPQETSIQVPLNLAQVELEIAKSFIQAAKQNQKGALQTVIDALEISYQTTGNTSYLYWKGYALYYQSISCLIYKKKEQAESLVNEGIAVLKAIPQLGSEEHALLGMMLNYSCQFLNFPKVVRVAKEASSHVEQALKLDEQNPRAYFVFANNDYHIPELFGGGKKVVEYAQKSLNLPNTKKGNGPTWGRQECFELMSNYYLREDQKAKAQEYIIQGLKEYPESYILKMNQEKL